MNNTIIAEFIESVEYNQKKYGYGLEMAEVCEDRIEIAYNKGILKGLALALDILNATINEELEDMAANMEGEKND